MKDKMRVTSYDAALRSARARIIENYGKITAFLEHPDFKDVKYKSRSGKPVDLWTIRGYLSVPRDKNAKKTTGKNFKFLQALYESWGILITQEQVVKKETIIRIEQ